MGSNDERKIFCDKGRILETAGTAWSLVEEAVFEVIVKVVVVSAGGRGRNSEAFCWFPDVRSAGGTKAVACAAANKTVNKDSRGFFMVCWILKCSLPTRQVLAYACIGDGGGPTNRCY